MAKAKRKLKLFIVPKAFKVREKAGPEPQLMYLQSDHLCICKDNLSQFEHSPTVPLFGKSMTMADLQFVALDLGRIEFWVLGNFFLLGSGCLIGLQKNVENMSFQKTCRIVLS